MHICSDYYAFVSEPELVIVEFQYMLVLYDIMLLRNLKKGESLVFMKFISKLVVYSLTN